MNKKDDPSSSDKDDKTTILDPDLTRISYLPEQEKKNEEINVISKLPQVHGQISNDHPKESDRKAKKNIFSPKTRKVILYLLVIYFVLDFLVPDNDKKNSNPKEALYLALNRPKILTPNPTEAQNNFENGLLYYRFADYPNYVKALTYFKKSFERDSKNPTVIFYYADTFLRLTHYTPNPETYYSTLGLILSQIEEKDSQNILWFPETIGIKLRFAQLQYPFANTDNLSFLIEKREIYKHHPIYEFELLNSLNSNGLNSQSSELASRLLENYQDHPDLHYLLDLGEYYLENSNLKLASNLFLNVLKKNPNNPRAILGVATIFALNKDAANLSSTLKKVSKITLQNEELGKFLFLSALLDKLNGVENRSIESKILKAKKHSGDFELDSFLLSLRDPNYTYSFGSLTKEIRRVYFLIYQNQYKEAIFTLQNLRFKFKDLPIIPLLLGHAFETQGNNTLAASWYEEAAKSEDPMTLFLCIEGLGKLNETAKIGDLASVIKTKYFTHYLNSFSEGLFYFFGNRPQDARANFLASLKAFDFSWITSFYLAKSYISSGNYEEALHILRRDVLGPNPASPEAYIELWSTWLKIQKQKNESIDVTSDAIKSLLQAKAYFQNDLKILTGTALLAMTNGDLTSARDLLMEESKENKTWKLELLRGELLFKEKNYNGAIKYLDSCTIINPNATACIIRRGQIYDFIGSPEKALNEYRTLLKLNTKMPGIQAKISELYRAFGDLKRALEAARSEKRAFPNSSAGYIQEGYIYMDAKRTKEAYELFSSALRIEPNNYSALIALGDLNLRMGNFETSESLLRKALSVPIQELQSKSDAYLLLAKVYFRQDLGQKKLDIIKEMLRFYPEQRDNPQVQELLRN